MCRPLPNKFVVDPLIRGGRHMMLKTICTIAGVALAAISLVYGTASRATTVTIPDPGAAGYIEYDDGAGNGSVTISGVTFSVSSSYSNGQFYEIGPQCPSCSANPPVLSSQQQSIGVANILISLPGLENYFSLNFGTFNGGTVTFALSNGATYTESPGGSGYSVPTVFSIAGQPSFNSVLVTTPDAVLNINNLVYSVPEPSTWAMILLGFAGLGFMSYRRKPRPSLMAA